MIQKQTPLQLARPTSRLAHQIHHSPAGSREEGVFLDTMPLLHDTQPLLKENE